MSAAVPTRDAAKRRSYGRFLDDVDELVPTRVFTRDRETSDVVQAAPLDRRGGLPSERALIARMLGELCSLAPSVDASQPLTWTHSNVFLTPPRPTDPSPPWAKLRAPRMGKEKRRKALPRRLPARKRRSILPLLALAMTTAIGIGLWQDPTARASVAADVAHATSTVTALLVELALR